MTGIKGRRLLVLVVLCCAFLIDVMGATSVMVAAPSIGRAFRLDSAGLQWSLVAATLPAAALLIVGARLADLIGRRPVILAGLAGTLLSLVACGAAVDSAMFIAARVGLGASAALLIPAALALLTDIFSEERDRRTAIATWSAIGGIGSTGGLLLGGLVTAGLGWRWIYLSSAIACLVVLPVAISILPGDRADRAPGRLDLPGLALFSAGAALLLFVISELPSAPSTGWLEPSTAIAATALLSAFALRQRRATDPLLPPRLFHSPTVSAGNVTLLVAGMLVDGLLVALSLVLQEVRGYSPMQFGGVAAVMTVTSIGAAALAQRLIARLGGLWVAVSGLGGLALTAVALTRSAAPHGSLVGLVFSMIGFGVAMGAAFTAGSLLSLDVKDERDNAAAAAAQNISFTLGTALGVAIVSAVAASTGDFGGHPLSEANPASLLAGINAGMWVTAGFAAAGAIGLILIGAQRSGVASRRGPCHSGSSAPRAR
ncbi:MAG TPA: MFS transporter [Solirubrobacteraceae bacterium]|nr:MFS transporter [Solirubrobacteraceae bacterium]